MVAAAERKRTTSTIQNKPMSGVDSVKKVDVPNQQTEDEAQSEMTRNEWIAEAAYYKAEARNFEPGHEQEDWMLAEQDYIKK